MEHQFSEIANSPILFIICLIPILFALIQAAGFIKLGITEAKELNLPKGTFKKVAINSALVTIVPSLPVVITLALLMAVLGKYIPWLRLSVMGSMAYESFAADLTVKAFGLGGLGKGVLTPSIFVSAVWVMTIAIMVSPMFNILFLKKYDKKLQSFREKGGFLSTAGSALLIGMLSVLFIPELVNFKHPTGILSGLVAGGCILFLDFYSKKSGSKILGQFSFPISMVLGMAAAVIAVVFNGGVQ